MTRPPLLSTGPMMPLMVQRLEDAFEVHWLHEMTDVDAFLASEGPRIEAVCTGVHTGVRTDAALIGRLPQLKVIGNYGVGYDTEKPAARTRAGGSGASIIRERAELIGCIYPARVWFDSQQGKGAKLTLEIMVSHERLDKKQA